MGKHSEFYSQDREWTMIDRTIQTATPAILVAEREPVSRTSLSELLREEGYRVIEAAESCAALAELRRDPSIGIILADLEMPSWMNLVQQAHCRRPESYILGMLRYGALANALEAQHLGAHGYLIKPLQFTEVNQRIQRFLTGQSQIAL
jgi:DNA-binding NtrC family response regulator